MLGESHSLRLCHLAATTGRHLCMKLYKAMTIGLDTLVNASAHDFRIWVAHATSAFVRLTGVTNGRLIDPSLLCRF